MRLTLSLPGLTGRWRRLEARLRSAGAKRARTVVSTPGPERYEQWAATGATFVVRLEGERPEGIWACAEITIEATGDPTDIAHLRLGRAPVLTMAGVREIPPAHEGA